jgi:methylated-DNA-[protein]-cysteine S-methyltransferase
MVLSARFRSIIMSLTPINFREKCYQKLREVPSGYVTTYKSLALSLGSKAYRAVGTAMAKNPDIPNTPCHRAVCSDGRVGEYALGAERKILLLESEGVEIKNKKVVNLKKKLWEF